MENEVPCHTDAIIDSLKLKSQEKMKTEEPQETIAKRVKLEGQNTRK